MTGRVEGEPLRLLGVEQIAALLGTDRREINALIESGQLPCVRVGVSREPRVSRTMLDEWQRLMARGETVDALAVARRRRGRAS